MKIELQPFATPDEVGLKGPPRNRGEGFQVGPRWSLAELDPLVLAQLCDAFRAEIFRKAGKPDPGVLPVADAVDV